MVGEIAPAANGIEIQFALLIGKNMAQGDHIYINGTAAGIPYQHHGIDMGDGTVIHLAPANGVRIAINDSSDRFMVRRDSMADFCRGSQPVTVNHRCERSGEEICIEAEKRLGQCGYSLLEGNCEHFARLCACGRAESHQIELGQATVSALASMSTKAFWSITGRISGGLAVRGAVKLHPAALIADGVEIATLAVGCQQGMDSERAKRYARFGSSVAAVGIGAVFGGPAGAALSLAAHRSSTAIADQFCKVVRHALSQK